ncbi:MAG: TIM barrel protein [Anaerolineae bacterium]
MTNINEDKLHFGTVGSPQTTPRSGTQAAISHMVDLGLHHLEIAWTRSVRVGDDTCANIQQTAQKHAITLSVHAPYFINLNSQTREKMAASDERLLTAARKGYLAGARDIVFHPGSYHRQPPEQVYEHVKEKLIELTTILREEGTDVILRPETMGKQANFGNLAEIVELSAEIEGVLPCIDWAHCHARRGDGTFNSYDEFAGALNLIRDKLGEDVLHHQMHCHMSGIAYTPKGEKAHIPLYEADFDYLALLQALIDFKVGGTVAVEAPQPFHTADALSLQATYRHLLTQK